MFGVYVHVPWCRVRCPYCAFAVDTRTEIPHDEWLAGVARDWRQERPHFAGRSTTLAFGGGTPSRARVADLAQVIDWVAPSGEVSLEANPEDVSATAVAAWIRAGVNRVTVGVQTTLPTHARHLGRAHSARQARAAVSLLRDSELGSVGLDLIFGVPGQSLADFAADLSFAVESKVDHVSLYGLTVEAGTRFAERGVPEADGDAWREMYDEGVRTLERAGLHRYEVSNFARPGHRAQHNEHYWRARHWAGLGPSAHGWRPDGTRVARPAAWDDWSTGAPSLEERPEPRALLRELLWSTLRHVDGADRARLRALTGIEVRLPAALANGDLATIVGDRVRLQDAGYPLADAISEAIWTASVAGGPRHPIDDGAYLPGAAGD